MIFAPVLGPALGGWITDTYSWRWVFLINVPIGILAFIAVAQLVEDPPWVHAPIAAARDIDYVGLGLIALGFGCLQIMLDRGEDEDWFGSPSIRLLALVRSSGWRARCCGSRWRASRWWICASTRTAASRSAACCCS